MELWVGKAWLIPFLLFFDIRTLPSGILTMYKVELMDVIRVSGLQKEKCHTLIGRKNYAKGETATQHHIFLYR